MVIWIFIKMNFNMTKKWESIVSEQTLGTEVQIDI